MNALQYAVARVAEQYRRRIQAGETLAAHEEKNNAAVRAVTLRYEILEEQERRGGITASMRSPVLQKKQMTGAQACQKRTFHETSRIHL